MMLRVTTGAFETEEGIVSRKMLPQGAEIPDDYFMHLRAVILAISNEVDALAAEAREALNASPEMPAKA